MDCSLKMAIKLQNCGPADSALSRSQLHSSLESVNTIDGEEMWYDLWLHPCHLAIPAQILTFPSGYLPISLCLQDSKGSWRLMVWTPHLFWCECWPIVFMCSSCAVIQHMVYTETKRLMIPVTADETKWLKREKRRKRNCQVSFPLYLVAGRSILWAWWVKSV